MKKKVIGIVAAIVVVLGLSLVVYNQIIPNEYVPADDEIALHLQFDTEEDIGLLVYDYRVDSHEYSGGISNADGSLIKRDADNIVVLNKEELNNIANTFELSMQFRIITEYVAPNYEMYIQMTSQSIWSLFRGKRTLVNHILLPLPVIKQMDIKLY